MKLNVKRLEKEWALELDPKKTAVIICDMWDRHWCSGATARCGEMAPRINEVVCKCRDLGMKIIHAPSETLNYYADHPGKKIIDETPLTKIKDHSELNKTLTPFTLDCSDGGCDCEPTCPDVNKQYWTKQTDAILIKDEDLIGDNEKIICYLLKNGYTNVILTGVHANMCIVGRSFALKSLISNGIEPIFIRDTTDAMYNHKKAPFVSHFEGNRMTVEWIERNLCPTTLSSDIIGGEPFKFKDDI